MRCVLGVTVIISVLLPSGSGLLKGFVQFPDYGQELVDPTGTFAVVNVNAENDEDVAVLGDNHALYLKVISNGQTARLVPYGRFVRVLWSPDGQGLLVNDYGDSDQSTCLVFVAKDGHEVANLRDELDKQVGPQHLDHMYVECTQWSSPSKVLLRIRGYGEHRTSVSEEFAYDLVEGLVLRIP